jgi:hypothetical protein
MANPKNKYAIAAEAGLKELGGGPVRSKTLVDFLTGKGLIPNVEYAYNYTLKACKESTVFDTSKRGYIGLAVAAAVEAPAYFGNEEAIDAPGVLVADNYAAVGEGEV